jgi:CubicO group peptidase (beta-lactamase class C family)
MIRFIRLSIAVAALSLLSTAHAAERGEWHSQLERILAAYHDVYGFSGAVRVARGSEPMFEQAVGRADRRFGTPFAPDTRNSINSISKRTCPA